MVPFDRSHMGSYSSSIVIMAISWYFTDCRHLKLTVFAHNYDVTAIFGAINYDRRRKESKTGRVYEARGGGGIRRFGLRARCRLIALFI